MAQQILFVLHVSQGKNMQSSSIFHVHSVWVNTILVEHLTFLTAVPERVRTNCKLMWVVNVSLTSVPSELKNKPFPAPPKGS